MVGPQEISPFTKEMCQHMQGYEPGWYFGRWCQPDGTPGGWVFFPKRTRDAYQGNEPEKPKPFPDVFDPVVSQFWDGMVLHTQHPSTQKE